MMEKHTIKALPNANIIATARFRRLWFIFFEQGARCSLHFILFIFVYLEIMLIFAAEI